MGQTTQRPGSTPWLPSALLSFRRRAAAVISEYNYARRRQAQLRLEPAQYGGDHDRAPGTYPEFLLLTSGRLTREPAARDRASR